MNEDLGSGQDRIVVGVDGSEPSKSALRWAARMSAMSGAPIDAVIAWQPPPNYGWGYMNATWRPDVDADKIINAAVDSVFGTDRPSGIRLIIERGNPAKVLLDHSRGAQMLIVGSRGHGGFVGLLLGSVSANCAEHATCPVLVVHGTPADNEDEQAGEES
ncbi:MAG TPA: universal stress protein [Jatrophihabitantaceae bacterium]|jgi:nucleotide-binding universal stress UspA family protein